MSFTLSPLPYALDALAPLLSRETLDFHYNKHHAGYVTKLNSLLKAADCPSHLKSLTTLEAILQSPASQLPKGIHNTAAQIWNHDFYWKSMRPATSNSSNEPTPRVAALLAKNFGSVDAFKKKFSDVAGGHFGSGWAWLVQEKNTGALKIVETHDAVSVISDKNLKPILTCDVWEHAYYIDFRNARPKYIESWWKLVNWTFAEKNIDFAKL